MQTIYAVLSNLVAALNKGGSMEKQSLAKQAAIGAFFGILFTLINLFKHSDGPSWASAAGLLQIAGGAFGGVILYMLIYRFWPKK